WSLVELTDTDGRRFIVARRNNPETQGSPTLSRRQRQVLFYASMGWSLRQIGYSLGLPADGSVTHHPRTGLRKLGFNSRAELIRTAAEAVARMAPFAPSREDERQIALSPAERSVAELVAAGWSNE